MPAVTSPGVLPEISLGGRLSRDLRARVERVTVESQRHLPSMCLLEFLDPAREVIDDAALRPGQDLKIESSPAGDDPGLPVPETLFEGEIVAVEATIAHGDSRVAVRAYDRGHRLHRRRRSRTWLNQSDADVVRAIARDHGLTADVGSTGGSHDYLCQHQQTDWEFLVSRAAEIGFEIVMEGDKLRFHKLGESTSPMPVTLELPDTLLSFRSRVTGAEQYGDTDYQGWEPKDPDEVAGSASARSENSPGERSFAADQLAGGFGTSEDVSSYPPLDTQNAAERWATGRRAHSMGVAYEAEGTCFGQPKMRAGSKVRLEGIGTRFAGTYLLSTVKHVFDAQGFITHFAINGRHDRSLFGLASVGAGTSTSNGHGRGGREPLPPVAIAVVTNLNDPDELGRVKVKLPWLGDDIETFWAPVLSPGGGSGGGWQLLPEVGDQVVVLFDHGDVRRPIIIGGVYNSGDTPPEPDAVVDGKTEKRCFTTREGHRLLFEDKDRGKRILLNTADGVRLEMTDDPDPTITISDTDGDTNSIVIDGRARTVTVRSGGDLKLDATGNLELEAGGNLVLKARGNLTAEATGQAKVKGTSTAELEGGASTTVKASGTVTVQGAMVRLN